MGYYDDDESDNRRKLPELDRSRQVEPGLQPLTDDMIRQDRALWDRKPSAPPPALDDDDDFGNFDDGPSGPTYH